MERQFIYLNRLTFDEFEGEEKLYTSTEAEVLEAVNSVLETHYTTIDEAKRNPEVLDAFSIVEIITLEQQNRG